MANKQSELLIARLIKSGLLDYIDKFTNSSVNIREITFTVAVSGKNSVKFSVDNDGNVFFIPYRKFKLLINDNVNLTKMMVKGMESLWKKPKPDVFCMELFKFFISIAKYIDNNDEGYSIPHLQKNYIKNDIREIMAKLDGWYKTKEYRAIINKGNAKYVY